MQDSVVNREEVEAGFRYLCAQDRTEVLGEDARRQDLFAEEQDEKHGPVCRQLRVLIVGRRQGREKAVDQRLTDGSVTLHVDGAELGKESTVEQLVRYSFLCPHRERFGSFHVLLLMLTGDATRCPCGASPCIPVAHFGPLFGRLCDGAFCRLSLDRLPIVYGLQPRLDEFEPLSGKGGIAGSNGLFKAPNRSIGGFFVDEGVLVCAVVVNTVMVMIMVSRGRALRRGHGKPCVESSRVVARTVVLCRVVLCRGGRKTKCLGRWRSGHRCWKLNYRLRSTLQVMADALLGYKGPGAGHAKALNTEHSGSSGSSIVAQVPCLHLRRGNKC